MASRLICVEEDAVSLLFKVHLCKQEWWKKIRDELGESKKSDYFVVKTLQKRIRSQNGHIVEIFIKSGQNKEEIAE